MSEPALPPLLRHRLANGLRLVVQPDERLPLVAVNLWYHVGSRNERPGRTGFAHLFEHMLFQGSEHVGTNDHFRHLQRIGGVANGSTWYDRTNYYETVPANELDLALWLESDRMGFLLPALDETKLETQRGVVMNERRQRVDNQPYGRASEQLLELLVPEGHPYRWPVIGTMEDIAAATLPEVREFFATWYRPNNAVLTLVGDVDPADAVARVERWFGDIPGAPVPATEPAPLPPIETRITASTTDKVQLPRVYLAYRVAPYGTDEWFRASLVATLLAGGRSSPLYRDLVRDRRLAHDVSATIYPTAEIGVFLVVATASPGVAPTRLVEEIQRHFDDLAKEVADGDARRARNRTSSSLWAELEVLEERADQISMHTILFDRPEDAFGQAARYLSIPPHELADFAGDRLAPHRAVELTVMPEGASR